MASLTQKKALFMQWADFAVLQAQHDVVGRGYYSDPEPIEGSWEEGLEAINAYYGDGGDVEGGPSAVVSDIGSDVTSGGHEGSAVGVGSRAVAAPLAQQLADAANASNGHGAPNDSAASSLYDSVVAAESAAQQSTINADNTPSLASAAAASPQQTRAVGSVIVHGPFAPQVLPPPPPGFINVVWPSTAAYPSLPTAHPQDPPLAVGPPLFPQYGDGAILLSASDAEYDSSSSEEASEGEQQPREQPWDRVLVKAADGDDEAAKFLVPLLLGGMPVEGTPEELREIVPLLLENPAQECREEEDDPKLSELEGSIDGMSIAVPAPAPAPARQQRCSKRLRSQSPEKRVISLHKRMRNGLTALEGLKATGRNSAPAGEALDQDDSIPSARETGDSDSASEESSDDAPSRPITRQCARKTVPRGSCG